MSRELELEKDTHRHWCPVSEPFTGCDALLSALDKGWELLHPTCHQKTWLINERRITIFYFWLRSDSEVFCIRVINTPAVHSLIQTLRLKVIPYSSGQDFAEHSLYLHTQQLLY